jgi:hypothetical protein
MKIASLILSVVAGFTLCGWAQTNEPAASGARIMFAASDFDFGKVDSGTEVKHEFVFTNMGNQTLEVTSVKTSCGCTTAGDWDKKVDPGQTGKIPVQFNSSGYGGAVRKSVFVACNDPTRENVTLNLQGTIWKAFDLSPPFAVFNLKPEGQSNENLTIKITSNADEPVSVSHPACPNPAFQTELTTVKEGKEYELHITAVVSNVTGSISAPVTVDTTSVKMPTISITTFIMMQPLLSVSPPQIMLPSGPLAQETKYTVTIFNNGTSPVTLSDPTVNANGVKVELSERLPGREFNVTVSFPAGFESSFSVVATVKSNNPKCPTVTIPVYQPAATPQPQGGHAAAQPAPATASVASGK